ncbi:(2Fe-2S)-binding protein [Faunimonas sp. B44]|uniref:(2Fe-2S)-binding protein n=1 Tax=Faunimonas sp. B44 TaxID=3461493 RepID=UPI00404407AD
MIVCSCNIITRRAIEATIEEILGEDLYAVLTPGRIYHRMGKRGKCGGCFPQVVRIMLEHGEAIRERMKAEAEAAPPPDEERIQIEVERVTVVVERRVAILEPL